MTYSYFHVEEFGVELLDVNLRKEWFVERLNCLEIKILSCQHRHTKKKKIMNVKCPSLPQYCKEA